MEYFLVVAFMFTPNVLISDPLTEAECNKMKQEFLYNFKKQGHNKEKEIKSITCEKGSIVESPTPGQSTAPQEQHI